MLVIYLQPNRALPFLSLSKELGKIRAVKIPDTHILWLHNFAAEKQSQTKEKLPVYATRQVSSLSGTGIPGLLRARPVGILYPLRTAFLDLGTSFPHPDLCHTRPGIASQDSPPLVSMGPGKLEAERTQHSRRSGPKPLESIVVTGMVKM